MKIQRMLLPTAFLFVTSTGLFFAQKKKKSEKQQIKYDTIKVDGKTVNPTFYATEQTLDVLLKEKRAAIVHYGLVPVYNPEFEKKYGIKIHNQGCVVMSGENNPAKMNNVLISKHLTKNFGENWKKDLGFIPFGADNQE